MRHVINSQAAKVFCLVMMLLAVMLMVNPQGFTQQTGTAESPAAAQKEEEPLPGLAELVHEATRLDENFSDLQRRIANVYDPQKAETQFASITETLDKLKEKTKKLQSADKPNYQNLTELKSAFRENAKHASDMIESVTAAINKVEGWRAEWLGEFERWTKWQEALLQTVAINMVQSTFTRA